MSKTLPSDKSIWGGSKDERRKQLGGSIGAGFGMPLAGLGHNEKFNDKYNNGGSPAWLNPKDWKNGKLEGELTGDRDTDMKHGLAKYGLFAAPWAPALLRESGKKGSKLREQAHNERVATERQGRFDAIQPTVNDTQFQGNNPYTGGGYNDTAAGLLGVPEPGMQSGMQQPTMGIQQPGIQSQSPGGIDPDQMYSTQPVPPPAQQPGMSTGGQYGGINPGYSTQPVPPPAGINDQFGGMKSGGQYGGINPGGMYSGGLQGRQAPLDQNKSSSPYSATLPTQQGMGNMRGQGNAQLMQWLLENQNQMGGLL